MCWPEEFWLRLTMLESGAREQEMTKADQKWSIKEGRGASLAPLSLFLVQTTLLVSYQELSDITLRDSHLFYIPRLSAGINCRLATPYTIHATSSGHLPSLFRLVLSRPLKVRIPQNLNPVKSATSIT